MAIEITHASANTFGAESKVSAPGSRWRLAFLQLIATRRHAVDGANVMATVELNGVATNATHKGQPIFGSIRLTLNAEELDALGRSMTEAAAWLKAAATLIS